MDQAAYLASERFRDGHKSYKAVPDVADCTAERLGILK